VTGGTWSSSDTVVATVNATTGLVTAVSAGTSTITYTVIGTGGCPNATATRIVTVTAPVSAGTLSGNQTLCVGSTDSYTSTVIGGIWSSSNQAIALVSSVTGVVTAISAGTATITYTITGTGGCPNATSTRIVTVTAPIQSAGNITGCLNLCAGATCLFSSSVASGIWSSSNTAVATIDSITGMLTAVSQGQSIVTYTIPAIGGCGIVSTNRPLTVSSPPQVGSIGGDSVVCVGSQTICTNTSTGGTWSSIPQTVATVNSNGIVTGISPGQVVIQYTIPGSGGCSNAIASKTISVTAAPVAGVLTGNQNICIGNSSQFFSTSPSGTWSSSDTSVARVNPVTGVVTGVSAGAAVISYTVLGTGGCLNATASRYVIVTLPPNAGIISGQQVICLGNSVQYTSTVSGGSWSSDNTTVVSINANSGIAYGVQVGTTSIKYIIFGSGGCPSDTANWTVTVTAPPSAGTLNGNQSLCVGSTDTYTSTVQGGSWSSSNTSVATVNATTGLVTALVVGASTITYTVIGTGGCPNATATRTVTVNPKPATPTITLSVTADTLFSSIPSGVQWSRNGQYISPPGPFLAINQNGVYRAVVVGANGCVSDSSNAINVTNVSVSSFEFNDLNVFPNPSSGLAWIQFQTPDNEPIRWLLLNSVGQVVRKDYFDNQGERLQKIELNFADLAAGLYTLQLRQTNRIGQVKCLIQR